MTIRVFLFIALFLHQSERVFAMGGQKPLPDLEVVQSVDLSRYAGVWYEIVRLPQRFEANCVGVKAEYQLRNDGRVDVRNSCRKYSCSAETSTAKGLARVVDPDTNAKLKVSFFWPFEGDYWILELDSDYNYSVVGSPDRRSFWILSRTPQMSDSLKQEILERFTAKGFNFDAVETTLPCE